MKHEIFAVKLCELEREYGRLQSRIQLFQGKNLKQICRERERMEDEYHESGLLLEETARSCRSEAMAHLAELQQDYVEQTEKLLQSNVAAENSDPEPKDSRDLAEKVTLFAEFAIDLATQSMRYALITALTAMELQMKADANTTEGAHDEDE